ncbi:hypothetical protein ACSBL2_19810 [Pedobacter sp. AW31-3R]|uniref:hypothetical protein n=1 Tax=Pedobacter sp. AW31-3R TaxID=3445781 RepID=UPI003FA1424C
MKKTYPIARFLFALLLILSVYSCKKDKNMISELPSGDSFLPMQVGNSWYLNKYNYTEIQDSIMISGALYYKFYSVVGGDGISISYMRIDENGRLIISDPRNPEYTSVQADFNAKVGDTFFTTGKGNDTDNEVTVVQKSDKEVVFSFDAIYHTNLKGHPYQVRYIKGQGFPGNWTRLKINGVVYK